jgi:hypothetical protein
VQFHKEASSAVHTAVNQNKLHPKPGTVSNKCGLFPFNDLSNACRTQIMPEMADTRKKVVRRLILDDDLTCLDFPLLTY